MPSNLLDPNTQTLLDLALDEDLGHPRCDATTALLFPGAQTGLSAHIISKHPTPLVICGIDIVRALFERLPGTCELYTPLKDGDQLLPGQTLLTLEGDPSTLLMGERVALNFLRHLSAVATLTRAFVEKVKGTSLKILDTRKTTPGFRILEKYAVRTGGGVNHRMGLYDALMIKDTHIDLLGSLEIALAKLPERTKDTLPVILEIANPEDLDLVLTQGLNKISRVLLDNMSLIELTTCVARCKDHIDTEASGNITFNTITDIAKTGVDYASIGMLTHSAGHVDLSMSIAE